MVALTEFIRVRAEALFRGSELEEASRLLTNECANNLPFHDDSSPESLDRIRAAALKISEGDLGKLQEAVDLAKIDWRDVLVGADFGNDVHAHERWDPRNERC
jgi:hypothetical protein